MAQTPALDAAVGSPIWAETRHSVLIPFQREGGSQVYEVPVTGVRPRELVRFDGPVQRSGNGAMVERGGQLYFTLGESERATCGSSSSKAFGEETPGSAQ